MADVVDVVGVVADAVVVVAVGVVVIVVAAAIADGSLFCGWCRCCCWC